ncbi:MAG: hypothetical protein R2750_02960 [Bacteroidales bacterium]
MQTELNNYIVNLELEKASNWDKRNFLEICAILIIWNIGKKEVLEPKTFETLSILENDPSVDIAKNAKMVLILYSDSIQH